MGRSTSGSSGLAKKESPSNRVRLMQGPRNRNNTKSPSNAGMMNTGIGRSNHEDSQSSEDSEDSEEEVTESESESATSESSDEVSSHPMTLRDRVPKAGGSFEKTKFRDEVMRIGEVEKRGSGKFRIQQSAVDILQNVAEQGLVKLFSKSGTLAKTRGRQNVTVTDMQAAKQIMDHLQNSSN